MRTSSLLSLSTSRRVYIPLSLLLALIIWNSFTSHEDQNLPPVFEITDLRIKDYQVYDAGYADNARYSQTKSLTTSVSLTSSFPSLFSYEQLQSKLRDFVKWDRPDTGHWPPWHRYDEEEYDPNRWEAFERQTNLFMNNTVLELERHRIFAEPFLPYPEYNGGQWRTQWAGEYVRCQGPAGEVYFESDTDDLVTQGYRFPAQNRQQETLGSARILGLNDNVCFDRHARLHAYGIGAVDGRLTLNQGGLPRHITWDEVRWGQLQNLCLRRNFERYAPLARSSSSLKPNKTMPDQDDALEDVNERMRIGSDTRKYKPRTAILIRTWEGYQYKDNDIQAIRSLITETALLSGGEYQVFLFVNIKQRDADIYDDEILYQDLLEKTVPKELRDVAMLWTEKVLEDWYPKVGDWQVYWMQFMPLQWFARHHPEFEYIWNWETDARYIGNHYHFLEKIAGYARGRPRKHLWERNARFYLPDLWNDDYSAFLRDTDQQILAASNSPIWGPSPYAPFQIPLGPTPPYPEHEDHFEWGVGEEADLITLQPIWDPSRTGWSYRNHIWNFVPSTRPHFTDDNPTHDGYSHPGFDKVPRRTFINTLARFSRRMLHIMHLENLEGRCMQAEMWPATVALHHGLKAVYAPHPIWTDRKWPA